MYTNSDNDCDTVLLKSLVWVTSITSDGIKSTKCEALLIVILWLCLVSALMLVQGKLQLDCVAPEIMLENFKNSSWFVYTAELTFLVGSFNQKGFKPAILHVNSSITSYVKESLQYV